MYLKGITVKRYGFIRIHYEQVSSSQNHILFLKFIINSYTCSRNTVKDSTYVSFVEGFQVNRGYYALEKTYVKQIIETE